jgi:hypothetical protein
MPAMRLILVHIFPRLKGSTRTTSGLYGKSSATKRTTISSRKIGSESVVRTLDRDTATAHGTNGEHGILFSRDFAVDYHDETSLVPLQKLSS